MKLAILFLFISASVFSQENFNVDGNKIIWQQVYESDLTEAEIKSQLKSNAILTEVAGDLTGTSKPQKIKCAETTPIYMRDALQYFVQIAVKEGRYKVSLSNFQIEPSVTVDWGTVETTNAPVAIEDYMLNNKKELRTGKMHSNSRECLDTYFQELFSFSNKTEEW